MNGGANQSPPWRVELVMRHLAFVAALLALVLVSSSLAHVQSATPDGIDRLMTTLHDRGQFNGSVIVAKRGEVLYRHGFGEANMATHQAFTPETQSCLASLSKAFTAMTIMMLAEQQKLGYDDPASRYLPELAAYPREVTIRSLLTHTSGLRDLDDLGIDHPGLTNDEVIAAIAKQPTLRFEPGTRYNYSNAGYILLSLIAERISGRPFRALIKERILDPLGMKNTVFYDGAPSTVERAAVGYSQFGKISGFNALTTGDGGMYSTVDDLLKWDQALYGEALVKQSTLAAAFTPATVKEGTNTYGFGWNITKDADRTLVWHTGNTGGYRGFIGRRLDDRLTVIMLTNKGNSKRIEINEAILRIVDNKPFTLPKRSIAETMYQTIESQGIRAALDLYASLKARDDGSYDFGEPELNALGYELLLGKRSPDDAVQVFRLNTETYPTSSNAFDSLGEAYEKRGQRTLAKASYQRAVDLDPTNLHAIATLKRLLADR
jgi:CubicO group peptidase (beta-lactamase class C family)